MLEINKIHNLDCFDGLDLLDDESIDCVITSPPYWALRDYGTESQIGLEKTADLFVEKLMDLFNKIHRVLKPTGTCWVLTLGTLMPEVAKVHGMVETMKLIVQKKVSPLIKNQTLMKMSTQNR